MRGSGLSVRIVLVRPRNPLNIGAAARAMANFGFSDLVVVKPYAPVWRETVSAVGAETLVLDARAVNSLEEAVDDCHWVVGTTTTRHRRLDRPLARLPEWHEVRRRRKGGALRLAVLFGSEKTGLPNKYLERCHHLLTIPTHPKCPSMNLGQAVAVCCYEISKSLHGLGPPVPAEEPDIPAARDLRQLVRHAQEVIDALDYLPFLSPAERSGKLWRTFLQWRVRKMDLALLHGFLRHVQKRLQKSR